MLRFQTPFLLIEAYGGTFCGIGFLYANIDAPIFQQHDSTDELTKYTSRQSSQSALYRLTEYASERTQWRYWAGEQTTASSN